MLRFLTAGETHGKCLTLIIEGVPAGVKIDVEEINKMLSRRQEGHGRGGRMAIETDQAEILSGVRNSYTLGSPIAIKIENKDWKNWEDIMNCEKIIPGREVTTPRPGHADLTGGLKYNHKDLRNVLERASARETAARVAAGAVAKAILKLFDVEVYSKTECIGEVFDEYEVLDEAVFEKSKKSSVGFYSEDKEKEAVKYIDKIKASGESVGGIVKTVAKGVVAGLGSYVHYDRKLDAKIAFSVMSIQAIKGVEIGDGFKTGKTLGSEVHDEILYSDGFGRATNRAGGIEGGMSNGEDIIVTAVMKPIPTLYNPLKTVDILTKEEKSASVERSDVCAVKAASVVVESAVLFELAKEYLEKFGADCAEDIKANFSYYKERIKNF